MLSIRGSASTYGSRLCKFLIFNFGRSSPVTSRPSDENSRGKGARISPHLHSGSSLLGWREPDAT